MNGCLVCGERMSRAFTARVLNRYDVGYFHCNSCGYLRTEEPHWLDEAYASPIAAADTGLVKRNLDIAAKLTVLIYLCFDPRRSYVDLAGGYGLLTRLMRDAGFDFYWEDKYCENLLARGFEAAARPLKVAALTAFEVLEHLTDPLEFLTASMRRFDARSLVLSTETYAGAPPVPGSWWYYSFETGQHIAFYRQDTLRKLADRLGVDLFRIGGMYVLSARPLRNRALAARLCGRAAVPFAACIRRRLGSRTLEDNRLLLDQVNEHPQR